MSLEHAHARVSAFLAAYCGQAENRTPDATGDTDAISYLDHHVLTATDLRTLLDSVTPPLPGTLKSRFEALEPWAQRELRAVLAIHAEAHAEALAAEARDGANTIFWRGPGQEQHFLPNGVPVTFMLSTPYGDPTDPHIFDEPENLAHELRVMMTDGCLMITTPAPSRTLAVAPMSHRAVCITADLTPAPVLPSDGHSA